VCFTNDRYPRAVSPEGRSLAPGEWEVVPTMVKRGASIGANVTVICGVTIGEGAMVGAGSIVTRDIPPSSLAVGSPAKVIGPVR
jgi:UDP-2-acetamido-3-amino-2,3-dideoxy-glucuronate N-acetyltransferase